MVSLPNYTQVPNEFLDSRMGILSSSAFKVLMAICRKTFGFHKDRDRISFSQLRKITGIASNQTLWKAIEELKDDVNKYVFDGHSYFEINATASMQQYYGDTKNVDVTETVTSLYNNCKGTVTETVNTKETNLKETPKETLSSPPAQTKPDLATGVIRKITDYYNSLYSEDFPGFKPTWDAKTIKLVKADISRMGDENLGELIQMFFENPPEFVVKNATGLGYNSFHGQIDSLIMKRSRRKGK